MNRLDELRALAALMDARPEFNNVPVAKDDVRDLINIARAAQAWVDKMALVPGGMWPEEAALRTALAPLTEDADRPRSIRELVDRGKP
jgi:hypothetical protein